MAIWCWELGVRSWVIGYGRWELGAASWALGIGCCELKVECMIVGGKYLKTGTFVRKLPGNAGGLIACSVVIW